MRRRIRAQSVERVHERPQSGIGWQARGKICACAFLVNMWATQPLKACGGSKSNFYLRVMVSLLLRFGKQTGKAVSQTIDLMRAQNYWATPSRKVWP